VEWNLSNWNTYSVVYFNAAGRRLPRSCSDFLSR